MKQILFHPSLIKSLPRTLIDVDVEGNLLMLTFENDEYVIFKSTRDWGDSSEISISTNEIDDYEKKELGIISQDEYDALMEKARLARIAFDEKRQREQYEQLKAKFEPNR